MKAKTWEDRANRLSEMLSELFLKTLNLKERVVRLENEVKTLKKTIFE